VFYIYDNCMFYLLMFIMFILYFVSNHKKFACRNIFLALGFEMLHVTGHFFDSIRELIFFLVDLKLRLPICEI